MSKELVFVGDPMCSWCYGFSHELILALGDRPTFPLSIKMAGLWADATDVLDDAGKRFRLANWSRVQAATGLPFNRDALLARQGMIYNTEAISRAFIAACQLAPRAKPLQLFHRLQRAFYVDGRDTSQAEVLQRVLAEILLELDQPLPAQEILRTMNSADVMAKARADYAAVRTWGLTSFPQFLMISGQQILPLIPGFAKAAQILKVLESQGAI